jgi:hypothetical protein
MMVWFDAYVNDLVIGGDRLRRRPIHFGFVLYHFDMRRLS